jgi:hypothetical protein
MAADMVGTDDTLEWMMKLSSKTGLPITFAVRNSIRTRFLCH